MLGLTWSYKVSSWRLHPNSVHCKCLWNSFKRFRCKDIKLLDFCETKSSLPRTLFFTSGLLQTFQVNHQGSQKACSNEQHPVLTPSFGQCSNRSATCSVLRRDAKQLAVASCEKQITAHNSVRYLNSSQISSLKTQISVLCHSASGAHPTNNASPCVVK